MNSKTIATSGEPRLTTDSAEIERCAEMMVSTSPWSTFFFSKDQCQRSLDPQNGMRVYVVDVEGEIAGFVAVLPKGFAEEPLLEYICIEENYRDQGLGTRLLTFFEQRLFPSADNYYLLVSDINHKAKALYESLGYVQVGALSNYNLVDQTEYVMRKTVRPRQEKMANGSK